MYPAEKKKKISCKRKHDARWFANCNVKASLSEQFGLFFGYGFNANTFRWPLLIKCVEELLRRYVMCLDINVDVFHPTRRPTHLKRMETNNILRKTAPAPNAPQDRSSAANPSTPVHFIRSGVCANEEVATGKNIVVM